MICTMSYIDSKYLNILSPQLLKFQKKGDYLWNFRCPYCGDSQKSRSKARGFVYRKKNDLFYDMEEGAFKIIDDAMITELKNYKTE